jgi:hypothetical protein
VKTITLKMRDSPHSEHYGGQRGEHRMVELIIPLPKARLAEIQSCIAIFSCDDALVLSPLILPDESGDCYISGGKAHVVLWQKLTQCWVLRAQLECFGDTEGTQFISRTEISERVVFGKSLADSLDHLPEIADQPGAIAQLLTAMHRHGNKSVLDELGDAAGDLTYHGDRLVTDALTNIEINQLIDQALAALI